jgi:hypothetical protein
LPYFAISPNFFFRLRLRDGDHRLQAADQGENK